MSDRLPPLPALRAFEAAARHLSFKQAAAELHVTPGAVSQQIKALEDFLGVRLFVRLTRALALTDEARRMLPQLREGLEALAQAIDTVRRRAPAGQLRVSAPPSFAARWLVPRLPSFTNAFADIDVRLSSSLLTIDRRDDKGRAASEPGMLGADLVIRFGAGEYRGCDTHRLFSPSYIPVCSPSLLSGPHPLASAEDLRWHPLIHDDTVPELDDRPGWSQWLTLAGIPELPTLRGPRFDDPGLVIAAAIAGQGVALAAKPLVSAAIAAGRLVTPFETCIQSRFAYFLTLARGVSQRPAELAFRDWLLREAENEAEKAAAAR